MKNKPINVIISHQRIIERWVDSCTTCAQMDNLMNYINRERDKSPITVFVAWLSIVNRMIAKLEEMKNKL